jgi:hypothetical protein
LSITAHWIAIILRTTALELKVALIAFHQLCGNHDDESLTEIILQLLDRAGITVKVCCPLFSTMHFSYSLKVGHFTLDNAVNNKTMMEALERKLHERDITFDMADR